MLRNPTETTKLFVYIIESPSDVDAYHRRSEAQLLEQACFLNGLSCVSRQVISETAFKVALQDLKEAGLKRPGAIPILHVSAHGNSDGIEISGTFVPWIEFKKLLIPINRDLNGCLILCMSSCEGYAACSMAMHLEDKDLPFLAMVGNAGKPSWSETAVAYTVFYHHLQKGNKIKDAVEAMRVGSGNKDFLVRSADDARQGFLNYLRTFIPKPMASTPMPPRQTP